MTEPKLPPLTEPAAEKVVYVPQPADKGGCGGALSTMLKAMLAVIILVTFIAVGWLMYRAITGGDSSTNTTIIDRRGVVEAIDQVNKQIFIEHYNIVDVQYTEIPEGWAGLLGLKQDVVVLIRGRVPAGFDLSQVTEDAIWISPDDTQIQMVLPPPQVFEENVAIDFENSRVLVASDTCPNFLCPRDSLTAYQEEVLPTAQQLLIDYALENNILSQAADDGKAYYEQFLKSLGFEDVQVIITGYP